MDIEFFIFRLILVLCCEFNMLLCLCIIRPDRIRMGHVGSYTFRSRPRVRPCSPLGLGLGIQQRNFTIPGGPEAQKK